MAEKHTPVWRVTEAWGQTKEERERGEPKVLCFHEIVDDDGKTVLSTWAGPNLSAANLASAAPAMLEALEKYVEHYGDPLQCAAPT